jgi:hypothetical protein
MEIPLSKDARKWQRIARQYADEYLQPHEVDAELNEGALPPEITARNKQRAIELGFTAIDVPKSHGGLELPLESQVAIWEQLGRVTNALSWCFPEAQSWMFEACTEEQLQTYILPMMRGEKKDCYAITEAGPGSDVSGLEATAVRDGDDYVLNGEKWYVRQTCPTRTMKRFFLSMPVQPVSRLSPTRNSATPTHRTTRRTFSRMYASPLLSGLGNLAMAWPLRTAGSGMNAS